MGAMKVAFCLLLAALLVGCGTEQERIASEARRAEEQRIKTEPAQAVEQERLATEAKKAAEELAKQESSKRAEEERLGAEARKVEEQRANELLKQAEVAHKQKEQAEADSTLKQMDRENPEAALKQMEKEKVEAARKERERHRKEQENRIKKMAKELEIKDQTEETRKRILKNAGVEITAFDTATSLVTKFSDKYALSIQAAIRPNITFDADTVAGNPAVEIQVDLKPDGSITTITTVKSSGFRPWDVAATRALEKTERLPEDENGRVPPTLSITLRPRER